MCEGSRGFRPDSDSVVVAVRFHPSSLYEMLNGGVDANVTKLHLRPRQDGTLDLTGDKATDVDLMSNKGVQRAMFAVNDLLYVINTIDEAVPGEIMTAAARVESRIKELNSHEDS